MHRRLRRSNLRPAPNSRTNRVTLGTAQPFSRMFGMTKVQRECFRRLGRPAHGSGFMTRRARADVLARDHRLRLMTLKTRRVRRGPRRNRKCDTAIRGLMTRCTICLTNVPPVVEHCIEASQRRKPLYISRGMTDCADRTGISLFKLCGVTRSTWDMPRHFRRRAVAASHMANETRHPRVLLRVMSKSGEILGRLIANFVAIGCSRMFTGVRKNDRKTEDQQ